MVAGLSPSSAAEAVRSSATYSCKLITFGGACKSAGRLQSPEGNIPAMSKREVSRRIVAIDFKERVASGRRTCAGRRRRLIQRRHHKLQIKRFLADTCVVIREHQRDQQNGSGNCAAHCPTHGERIAQPFRELARSSRQHHGHQKRSLEYNYYHVRNDRTQEYCNKHLPAPASRQVNAATQSREDSQLFKQERGNGDCVSQRP